MSEDKGDRYWLLGLGLTALLGVIVIAILAIWRGIPEAAATLLGAIVGGLLMFMREIVQAIRSFWTDNRMGKMSDQLAGAPPTGGPSGSPGDPLSVEGAGPGTEPVTTKDVK